MYIKELFEDVTPSDNESILYHGMSFTRAVGAMMDNSIHGPSGGVTMFTDMSAAKKQARESVKDPKNLYGAIGAISAKVENELPPVGVVFELNGYRLTKGYHIQPLNVGFSGTYRVDGEIHELRQFIEHLEYPKTVARAYIERLVQAAAELGDDYVAQRFVATAKDFIGSISEAYDPEKEKVHFDALDRTGFYGAQGAGCIILAKDTGRLLFNHRSNMVEQPGTWGNWGGAIDPNEDPAVAARREVQEEAEYHGPLELFPLLVFTKGTFRYSNFLAVVASEFEPQLDWESQGYRWCDFGDFPEPLHFGMVSLFNDPASVATIKSHLKK
jgi:8-oxo-dGTP pyrophosphatase MutT (NUDIX family)